MQDWRLSQPHRLIDKLRNHLLIEITGAEWDVVDDNDFVDEGEDELAVTRWWISSQRKGEQKPGYECDECCYACGCISEQERREWVDEG